MSAEIHTVDCEITSLGPIIMGVTLSSIVVMTQAVSHLQGSMSSRDATVSAIHIARMQLKIIKSIRLSHHYSK